MNAIALSELRMLVRNRLVAASAILLPLVLGAFFIINRPDDGAVGFSATLQLATMLGLGVYVTATTTLAARRQNLFLKRLRSGAASDVSILSGLVLPILLVSVVQVAIVMTALGVSATLAPANPWLLVIVVLLVEAMFAGFALATSGVTNSPEHAQVTTLPLFLLAIGAPIWVAITGTEELGTLKRWLPGGSLPELMNIAWAGGSMVEVPLLLAPLAAWAAVALIAARVMFRWEPRS